MGNSIKESMEGRKQPSVQFSFPSTRRMLRLRNGFSYRRSSFPGLRVADDLGSSS